MTDAVSDIVIDALGGRGDGIGRDGTGRPVFVSGALPGEVARVRIVGKEGAGLRAELLEIVAPVPGRAAAPCRHFGTCGGCDVQHMGTGLYEEWKRGIVAEALSRETVAANVGPLHRVGAASRRRARLFAMRTGAGVAMGFQARASHRIVPMEMCPALEPKLFALVAPLRDFLARTLAPAARAEAEVQLVEGALDLVLRLPGALDRNLRERLARFAGEAGIARISWQPLGKGRRQALPPPEVVAALGPIRAVFGGVPVALPPLAFLQASAEGERALAAAVAARMPEGAYVADLYAGAGTFTFALAREKARRVSAFDAEPEMTAALQAAARAAGMGERVTATARDLERRPLLAKELDAFDAAVFDPPRGGAEAQARQIAASKLSVAVAVSCNPVSFARDARILMEGGFRIGPVMPVDQFVWTRHVEVVAAFSR